MITQHQSKASSRQVTSSQRFVHPNLPKLVIRHLNSANARPVAEHSEEAFNTLLKHIGPNPGPLILDSFCGTGMSTALLAETYANHIVIGIDKSANRLAKHQPAGKGSYHLIQADCGDIWRLCLEQGWTADYHFLLYPNPWPKPGHLQRRIHGSNDLASLLALGGKLELRSNWQTYAEEFGVALNLAGYSPMVDKIVGAEPLSLHERKYLHSGHSLWRCQANLGHNVRPGE